MLTPTASDVFTPEDLMRLFSRRLRTARIPHKRVRYGDCPMPSVVLSHPARDMERAGVLWRFTWAEVIG